MPLWRFDGNQLVTVNMASTDLGADAYLCCPGPSLAAVDEQILHVRGGMVFALNTAYPRIRRPDCWIGSDLPPCFDSGLWYESFMKINRPAFANELVGGRPLKTFPNAYFADLGAGDMLDILTRRGPDAEFVWPNNTFTMAMHLLVWFGARRIYLLGCDFGGRADYHDGRVLSSAARTENRRLYSNLVKDVARLAPEARKQGIHIVSCTANSPVNEFIAYMPLDKAVAQTAARSTPPDWKPANVREVERQRDSERVAWGNPPTEPVGVMVGITKDQEDILGWWWGAYRRQNDLPVAFVDYGMSRRARAWCEENGTVIDHGAPGDVRGWFRKPFAFLRSPFLRTVWADLDVEIRHDLRLLLAANCKPIAMGRDWSYPAYLQRRLGDQCTCWASSFCIFDHGEPLIEDWCRATIWRQKEFRGDQEVLSAILLEGGIAPLELPPSVTRSRQETESPTVVAMHWSGPGGKGAVRRAWPILRSGAALRMEDVFAAAWRLPEPTADRGLVVGADRHQEWLLAWWYETMRTHSQLPVMFADFGLTADGRNWCEQRGLLSPRITVGDDEGMYGWFKKPYGLLESPFRQAIWFDADVEIRGDVAPLFALADGGRLGITDDRGTPAEYRDPMPVGSTTYNSGVVAFNHGDPLIVEWASMTAALHSEKPFDMSTGQPGDQETLVLALNAMGRDRVREIPKELTRLRWEGEGQCLTMHWTGAVGKDHIRKLIESQAGAT